MDQATTSTTLLSEAEPVQSSAPADNGISKPSVSAVSVPFPNPYTVAMMMVVSLGIAGLPLPSAILFGALQVKALSAERQSQMPGAETKEHLAWITVRTLLQQIMVWSILVTYMQLPIYVAFLAGLPISDFIGPRSRVTVLARFIAAYAIPLAAFSVLHLLGQVLAHASAHVSCVSTPVYVVCILTSTIGTILPQVDEAYSHHWQRLEHMIAELLLDMSTTALGSMKKLE